MSVVYVGSASIDENGNAHGGKAGNQSGREILKQRWYLSSKGWRVLRAKSVAVADKIDRDMEYAIANRNVGYDQWERNSLYNYAEKVGFNISKVMTPCETDCSALVRVCCAYAGITGLPADFRTYNEAKNLLAKGAFIELTADKYTKQSAYLRKGDILVTATAGHTVVVLNSGDKAEDVPDTSETGGNTVDITLHVLKRGSKGAEVWTLQTLLKGLGYNLGSYGVDGDFGSATETAVKAYQKAKGLEVDGEVGKNTWNRLLKG